MKRLFIRRKDTMSRETIYNLSKTKQDIAVTGLGREVGTTMISTSLAFFFAEKGNYLTFTQCAEPCRANALIYDAVSMDRRFINRNFTDIYECIDRGEVIKKCKNIEEGINWILITPENCRKEITLNNEKRNRLIQCGRNEIGVYDIEADDDWNSYLLDMDRIIVVVDPLPSKLISQVSRFQHLKRMEVQGADILWLINKTNAGVDKKEVKRYLKSDRIVWLEMMPVQNIYALEYTSKFYWEDHYIRERLDEMFTQISQGKP